MTGTPLPMAAHPFPLISWKQVLWGSEAFPNFAISNFRPMMRYLKLPEAGSVSMSFWCVESARARQ